MSIFKQNEGVGCLKYIVITEVHRWEGAGMEEYSVLVPKGQPPAIGDYIRMFSEHLKLETQLSDIIERSKGSRVLEFKPVNPEPKGIQKVVVTRYVQDFTYRPVVKI